jgi:hypothetical protein
VVYEEEVIVKMDFDVQSATHSDAQRLLLEDVGTHSDLDGFSMPVGDGMGSLWNGQEISMIRRAQERNKSSRNQLLETLGTSQGVEVN